MAEFLNNNIKHLRTQKGISQQSLADKIGIDRSTVSRIENNEIETTIDNAVKISEVLSVPLTDLVGRDLTNESIPEYELADEVLFSKIKSLSDSDKELINSIIETRKKQIDEELGEDN